MATRTASSLTSRFQRRERGGKDERVGEILSDSNSELSSLDDGDDDEEEDDVRAKAVSSRQQQRTRPEIVSDESDDGMESAMAALPPSISAAATTTTTAEAAAVAAKVHQRPAPLQTIKRKNSKWYDSDDDDWDSHAVASDGGGGGGGRGKGDKGVVVASEAAPPPAPASAAPASTAAPPAPPSGVISPDATTLNGGKPAELGGKRSSFHRLVGKTFNLSPFGSKRKGLDITSPTSSGPDTPSGGSGRKDKNTKPAAATDRQDPVARMRSPLSDVSSPVGGGSAAGAAAATAAPLNRKKSRDPNRQDPAAAADQPASVVSPQNSTTTAKHADAASAHTSRRRTNSVQSPNGVENYSDGTPRRGSEMGIPPSVGDALSPGQRKMPGAFAGRPGSGVLLEGWLRQKQRRGVKGLKKWNSRYFVLYAGKKSNSGEVRYYADVVQSAWGPIPLGEIGSISLRLIQRIGKPGTLKYKGCRLDITCRNSWGTHYADDYVSSDDENTTDNNNRSTDKTTNNNNSTTPKSSRVYSLMADSPQTTHAWFSMLDSLLVRSANSPRVDVAPSSSSSSSAASAKQQQQQLKRMGSQATGVTSATSATATNKMRRRSSAAAMETDTMVLAGADDHVPKPVLEAINYIFDSTPGIETVKFYETEPDPAKLKAALKFLNQFATETTTRKPHKEELEQILDAVTAGAIVKLWLTQLEQPIVPFEMFDDFCALAQDAAAAPFELPRNLKALVHMLPPRNFARMACLLFHLNDVNVYSSKNGMDAATLARIFGKFIVRPRGTTATNQQQEDAEEEEENDTQQQLLRAVVEEMISHVDAIIDEKETEL